MASIEAGADALGFVFDKESQDILAQVMLKIIGSNLPPFIGRVWTYLSMREPNTMNHD